MKGKKVKKKKGKPRVHITIVDQSRRILITVYYS